jgi:hypothetical protein
MKYLNLVIDLMPMTLSKYNNDHCGNHFEGSKLTVIKKFCHKMFEGLAYMH